MKKLLSILTLAIAIMMQNCVNTSDTDNPVTTPVTEHKSVGAWEGALDAGDLIGYSVLFDVIIQSTPDTVYSLISRYYPSNDTALIHRGKWHINSSSDSIILQGTDCQIIDTTTKTMVQKDCGGPIPVFIDIDNGKWTIELTDLLPVAESLNINVKDPFIVAGAKLFDVILEKK